MFVFILLTPELPQNNCAVCANYDGPRRDLVNDSFNIRTGAGCNELYNVVTPVLFSLAKK
jgi:hypothetical protein